jgi:hypothetical protein
MFGSPSNLANILSTGPNSNNQINTASSNNLNVNSTETNRINNDINVRATSGNAEVSKNTNAGNAHTGDAITSVNVLNMINSQLTLSDWFGVLFINILGNWFGSFGIDTPNGNQYAQNTIQSNNVTGAINTLISSTTPYRNPVGNFSDAQYVNTAASGDNNDSKILGVVAADNDGTNVSPPPSTTEIVSAKNYIGPALIFLLIAGIFLGERIVATIRTGDEQTV